MIAWGRVSRGVVHAIWLASVMIPGCDRPSPSNALPPPQASASSTSTSASVIVNTPSAIPLEPGFQLIRFEEMAVFPNDETTASTWSSVDGEIVCTGKPKCYLYTREMHADGVLRFDYRFDPDPKITDPAKLEAHNTGVLLFIQEPHAIWPKSIEVQGKHSEMGQIRPNGGAVAIPYEDLAAVRETSRQQVGEWNTIEIVIRDGSITSSINGNIVARGKPGELKSGFIGLQSEGHRLRYRRLRFSPVVPAESP